MPMDCRSYVCRGIFLTLLAMVICGLAPDRGGAEPRRVLVVPFSIHSDKDLTFLRKGVTAMLSSRLTDAGKVAVIDQATAADIVKSLPTPVTREGAAEGFAGNALPVRCFFHIREHPLQHFRKWNVPLLTLHLFQEGPGHFHG